MSRARDKLFNNRQHDQLRSLSPTAGKSDARPIKGKKIKEETIHIRQPHPTSKPPKTKRNSDHDSIIQPSGILSDRYHY